MRIRLYQINSEKDSKRVRFLNYDSLAEFQGSGEVDATIYDCVYNGEVEAKTLEDVYRIFNIDHPNDYKGRSMSVSDVVERVDGNEAETGFFFCDSMGFKKICFDAEEAATYKPRKIRVLMVEPDKKAYEKEVGTSLEEIYETLDCQCFQTYYPFNDKVVLVCDDEGKINGSAPNRPIMDDNGVMIDIIFGKFFVCDCSGRSFSSLSDDMMRKYKEMFLLPCHFVRNGKVIVSMKFDPDPKKTD